MPTYPGNIPYKPDLNAFRILEPYAPPKETEYEDGPNLLRKSRLQQRAKLAYKINFFRYQDFASFVAFVKNTLIDGTMKFDMPVYEPLNNNFVVRECQLGGGTYTPEPFGLGFSVSFTLIVYNWGM